MLLRVALLLSAVALLASACGSSNEPPPRNPLDDSSTPAATATATAATPSATTAPTVPTATPTAVQGEPTAPPAQELEVFTGNALELMSEWLGIPVTDLRVDDAESLVWPDACLGIERPGGACAEILTPGFRIELSDAFENLHAVHASAAGDLRWRGELTDNGTVVSVQGLSLTLAGKSGERLLQVAPGSRIEGPGGPAGLETIAAGVRIAVAFDGAPSGSAIPVLAWLLVTEGS